MKNYSSGEAFAEEHGFKRATYCKYEAGNPIKITTLNKILAIHGVSFIDLFEAHI